MAYGQTWPMDELHSRTESNPVSVCLENTTSVVILGGIHELSVQVKAQVCPWNEGKGNDARH